MLTVNIHEAKTHLSRLLDRAAKGEPFIIAKAGKPLVKVVTLDAPETGRVPRLGFLAGQIEVPDDFDRMGQAEIESFLAMGREAAVGYAIAAVGGGAAGALLAAARSMIEDADNEPIFSVAGLGRSRSNPGSGAPIFGLMRGCCVVASSTMPMTSWPLPASTPRQSPICANPQGSF